MKTFDTAITAEMAKEVAAVFWLVEFQFDTPEFYTDCDIALLIEGHRYVPKSLSVGNITTTADSSVDSVEIEIANVDLQMSGILMNEEVRNKTADISFCHTDANNQIVGDVKEDLFPGGFISDWDLSEGSVKFHLVNELIFWNKRPLRTAQASCRWPFKGDECNYTGSEIWCDQPYSRCQKIGKTDNFGGHRFLPGIQEKEVWWGRTSK